MHQRKDQPVWAHVFVAALAFLLDRALEKNLRTAGSSVSSPAARCVSVEVGNRTKLCVTRGSRQATQVLEILKLSDWDPPQPPQGRETVM